MNEFVPCRQDWLRTRYVEPEEVDPMPLEEAVLEDRADDMRELVRRHVAQVVAQAREDSLEDEELLDDDELLEVETLGEMSEHQLRDFLDREEAILASQAAGESGDKRSAPEGKPESSTEEAGGQEPAKAGETTSTPTSAQ